MMEDEVVRKRQWVSAKDFARGFALLKVFPGPTGTQMAIHLGRLRKGRWGGLVAGLTYIFPSFVFILSLGILLTSLQEISWKGAFISGMQVAALGVIFQGAYRLAASNLQKDKSLLIVAVSAAVVFINPDLEFLIILFFGFLGLLIHWKFRALRESISLGLVYVCLKAALFTFGTGLAIVPLLEHDVVEKFKWLNHSQFLEALALGQITPGPVVITVTWIGYKLMQIPGALLATAAVFIPGFLVTLFFIPFIEKKWGEAPALQTFYRYVIPAVVGAMAAVSLKLFFLTVNNANTLGIFVASLVLVFWRKTPAWFVIPLLGVASIFLSEII